ncbi:MAG: radical SAM protein [Candidatus Omnitrophota bacterium]|nr:radical SAM protein [Candidatus Omnitrophota bacterium]
MLRLKGVEAGQALIGPAQVVLFLTNRCNLACKFCQFHAPGSAQSPSGTIHLPLDRFAKVVHDCIDLQVDKIFLSGDGEPTLNPHFYTMLRYLQQCPMSVVFFSNGTFPLGRCRDILMADGIIINLGEGGRTPYQELTGNGPFLRVIKNIRELARLRPQFNPDFRIEVVFVETSLNAKGFLRTEKLAFKLGADFVRKAAFKVSKHNQHIKLHAENTVVDKWSPCYHGWFDSAIRLNGDVKVCCYTDELTIGNAYETSFKDVWESEAYLRVRISALTGDTFRDFHTCRNCLLIRRNKKIAAQMKIYHGVRTPI